MKTFYGTCDEAQLKRFSMAVVGMSRAESALVIPASRNRRNCHIAYFTDGHQAHPFRTEGTHGKNSGAKVGHYELSRLAKIYWRSKSQNELTATAEGDGTFRLVLVERGYRCHYRDFLERNRVRLAVQG